MVYSSAGTVAAYLAELPRERRLVLAAVRDIVRRNLPGGFRETMKWGMITYELPLKLHPDTRNGQPLCYAGLAAQKHYFALYLTCAYQDPKQTKKLKEGFRKAGRKLDMGKSCVRFKTLEDLPLHVIAEVIASTSPEELIRRYEMGRHR